MRRRAILALLILLMVLSLVAYLTPLRDLAHPREAARFARAVGTAWWAPLAYLGLYFAFTLLLVPPMLLSAAAALMWGWLAGGTVELIAATLASVTPYLIARWSGAEWLRARVAKRGGASLWERLQREEFFAVLLFRLVPVIPYVVLNYVAGFASIHPGKYLVATFLGMIPSIFLFTYFVDALAGGTAELTEALPRIFIAGGAIALLILITRIAARKVR